MSKIPLTGTFLLAAAAAWAQEKPGLVFHDPEDGVFVIRHSELAKEVGAADSRCREYHAAVARYERDYGDGLTAP